MGAIFARNVGLRAVPLSVQFTYTYTVTYTDDAPCDIADAIATAELVVALGEPPNAEQHWWSKNHPPRRGSTTEFLQYYDASPPNKDMDVYMYAKFILDAVQWLREHQGFKL